jgi:hypothetical protein
MNAKEKLATFAAWLKASSASTPAPLGREWVLQGPLCVLLPSQLDAAPSNEFHPEALPLWVPKAQSPANLGPINLGQPYSGPAVYDRLAHLIWLIESCRLPAMAIIPLQTPEMTLQEALSAAGGQGIDQGSVPLLFVALYALPDNETRAFIERKLPLLF